MSSDSVSCQLGATDFARYARQLSLAGFGPDAQLALKRARVLVIGAGGLGCPILLYLVAAGVGRITLLDPDHVDVSNLQRQVLFATDDRGQPKAEVAARRLRALNPLIEIEPHAERLTRANALDFVSAHDVVVDGSDNFATRYLVNDACVIARRPFVYGAIQGFSGQVSVFNFHACNAGEGGGGGPTYRCLFPEPPESGEAPTCAEAGVLGVLPGIIGTLQAAETIKIITGIGRPLAGRLLLIDALTMEMRTLAITADPKNQLIHELPAEDFGQTCASMTQSASANGTAPAGPDEITIDELRALRAKGVHRQLIDVREDWERAESAIQPSVHAPLGQLGTPEAATVLAGLDPAQPTIVYCARGRRSLKALPPLRQYHGFANILSLQGGITSWDQK